MTADIRTEDRFVEVPGGEVFVRTWVPPSTTSTAPLILLHDSLGCVELWRDLPPTWARALGLRVIAYDRLGFGRSSPRRTPPLTTFIRDEAEVVFPALRRALGLRAHALFGYSVGGAMSLLIAASPNEPCVAVVTESAQAFVEDRTREGIRHAAERLGQPEQFARLARWHGDKAAWVLSAWRDVWLSPAFASWSLEPDLPRVRCPVLVIHGDRDEYGSLAFPRLIASRSGGPTELAILPGCGHVPHRERAGEVLERVSRWLPGVLAGASLAGGPPAR